MTEKDYANTGSRNSNYRRWSDSEKRLLMHICAECKQGDNKRISWKYVSKQISGRSPRVCYREYCKLVKENFGDCNLQGSSSTADDIQQRSSSYSNEDAQPEIGFNIHGSILEQMLLLAASK